ncbi:hypothetical protein [Burkholderia cepacia]|uniref:hypothetical protein n=1 Tax=Burkholderia cepacia TaxID=292 RepID=UPI0012D90339|nr:hypothetical protein [Burkholderia cepacia]
MTTDTHRGAGSKAAGAHGKRTSSRPARPGDVKEAGAKRDAEWPVTKSGSFPHFTVVKHVKTKAKARSLSVRLKEIYAVYSRQNKFEQRIRKVEQRMFVSENFGHTDPEFFRARISTSLRPIAGSRSASHGQFLYSDSELVATEVLSDAAASELSGPLDPSKVTMKPIRRSPEERRRSTLALLGIDPNKRR